MSPDGSKVVLTYNEDLSSTTADRSAFSVTTDGRANAVTAVAINGSTVELTLTNTVRNDQAVSVAYSDPSASMTPMRFKTSQAMTLPRSAAAPSPMFNSSSPISRFKPGNHRHSYLHH